MQDRAGRSADYAACRRDTLWIKRQAPSGSGTCTTTFDNSYRMRRKTFCARGHSWQSRLMRLLPLSLPQAERAVVDRVPRARRSRPDSRPLLSLHGSKVGSQSRLPTSLVSLEGVITTDSRTLSSLHGSTLAASLAWQPA